MSYRAVFQRLGANVLLPGVGFAGGWYAYEAAEAKGVISDATRRRVHLFHLRAQLYAQQYLLPQSVVEAYGYPAETLKGMIAVLEKGYTELLPDVRMTFEQILQLCPVEEQLRWLEEHVSYDIPYFYIGDLFNSFANLYEGTYLDVGAADGSPPSPLVRCRDDRHFDSDILCHGVWEKMVNGVIPFDVAVRALCVLAMNSTRNAAVLGRLAAAPAHAPPPEATATGAPSTSPPLLLAKLHDYLAERESARAAAAGDEEVVPVEKVAAATLQLLFVLNRAAVHRRWLPWVGRPSTGPLPLFSGADRRSWCGAALRDNAAVRRLAGDGAARLSEALDAHFQCADLPRRT